MEDSMLTGLCMEMISSSCKNVIVDFFWKYVKIWEEGSVFLSRRHLWEEQQSSQWLDKNDIKDRTNNKQMKEVLPG